MGTKRCIITVSLRRALIAAAALLGLVLAAVLLIRSGREKGSGPETRRTPDRLTAYDVQLRLDDKNDTLSIAETVRYRNDTGAELDSLVMRTWLNAFSSQDTSPAAAEEFFDACYPGGFSPGWIDLYDVLWNGERAEYAYVNGDRTALKITVPTLAPEEEGVLTLRCVAHIPECAHRIGRVGRDYQLGGVIPLLSRWEDGKWRTDEYSPIGDPFIGDCADFTLAAALPEGTVPCCSAELTLDGDGLWRGKIRGARDIALCLSPDCHTARGKAGNIAVLSCAKTEAGAKRALDCALHALETYSDLYGPYPYAGLSLWETDFPFGGMEYSGLCMIGKANYLESRRDTLELTVAHETAHQWFWGLVGSDQVNQPWQDEAVCEYAMLRYVRKRYGQGSFDTLKYYRVEEPMRENVPGNLTPGSPIDYFSSLQDYGAVVYGRGAALLLALDETLPGGTDGFLRAYADAFAFRYASRAQFEDFLNEYAGMDLGPLLLDYLDTMM